ncbi:hypothetical protein DLM75_10620 [Leptospira stimsonii]|uniref:Uncharacterized protein n=1 Tax=Leptospira stimsonii TaxID=2202203 RepID=A0A396ZCJ3_9LEPT|nr:hypothetical protein DLM75_10620 [Leptospira stimsonii]
MERKVFIVWFYEKGILDDLDPVRIFDPCERLRPSEKRQLFRENLPHPLLGGGRGGGKEQAIFLYHKINLLQAKVSFIDCRNSDKNRRFDGFVPIHFSFKT